MKRLIFTLIFICWAATAWAAHPIASAQFNSGRSIHVTLDDGREIDVPDDMANRHRRMVAEWVDEGNTIAPADPPTPLTRKQKIRRDPEFPRPSEFFEAFIDCRFNSKCSAAQALRNRLNDLRVKYP